MINSSLWSVSNTLGLPATDNVLFKTAFTDANSSIGNANASQLNLFQRNSDLMNLNYSVCSVERSFSEMWLLKTTVFLP